MKNFLKKFTLAAVMIVFSATLGMAAIVPGDLQRVLTPATSLFNMFGKLIVKSGGTVEVKSGGTLQLDSGSTLTISNASSFATMGATTIQAGASGTAGVVKAFPATAANGFLELLPVNNTGAFNSIISNMNSGQTTTYSLTDCGSATCNLLASKGDQTIAGAQTLSHAGTALTVTNNAAVGTLNGNTITTGTGVLTLGAAKTLTVSNTMTLAAGADSQTFTFPSVSDTVAGIGTAQTFTAAQTFGAGSNIISKTATSLVDVAPPFDSRLRGNAVVKTVYGNALIADINAGNGTAIILVGESSRKIYVVGFDLVAAGSAATCTGIFLTDSSNVRVATLAAATLTSGAHNVPLAATLGVGFGAGSGLTAGASLQLLVNGSACTTTTSVEYSVTYAIQ